MNLTCYLVWRIAAARYGRRPWQLSEAERAEVQAQAAREHGVITRALTLSECSASGADPEVVEAAVGAWAAGFPDQETFHAELSRGGLDGAGLREAISAELRAGLALEQIGAGVTVDESEVRAWFERRQGQLVAPERRVARHVLITFDEESLENGPVRARERMARVAEELEKGAGFEALALRHSECPSALDGGRLGEVRRGQLYAELEAALFALQPGGWCVAESPLGVHLLRCDAVIPPQPISYEAAAPSIRTRLEGVARERAMKAWLAEQEREEGSGAPPPVSRSFR
jgi:nitrogen fixation protein NifM